MQHLMCVNPNYYEIEKKGENISEKCKRFIKFNIYYSYYILL
jgi:hypothetical protein